MNHVNEPITPEPVVLSPPPPQPVQRKVDSSLPPLRLGSIICLALAIFITFLGLFMAWSAPREVSGDGYNFIIGASRGIAIVCTGISLGVISLVLAIYDLRTEIMENQ